MATIEYDDGMIVSLGLCGFALLFSVPFHILLIIVLVRYRKATVFAFPFFTMLLSLAINDLLASAVNGVGFVMYLLPAKTIVIYSTPWFGIIPDIFFGLGIMGNSIILVAIGINRLVAYVFPLRMIWRPIHTKCAIVIQWFFALSFGFIGFHPDLQRSFTLNETSGGLIGILPENTMYQLRFVIVSITILVSGFILAVLYSISVGKLIYHKMTTNVGQGTENLTAEAKLSFQGFFLSSSLLISAFLYLYASVNSFSVSAVFFGLLFMAAVSNFVIGPFIVIGMSSVIRKHIEKMFKRDTNVVHILPTANVQQNESQL